jgi:hypothetical protein
LKRYAEQRLDFVINIDEGGKATEKFSEKDGESRA